MLCTVELFEGGRWLPVCSVQAHDPDGGRETPSRLVFTPEALAGGFSPSLRLPPGSGPLELSEWPSFLFDLIPQGDGRQYLAEVLEIPDTSASDWRMLLMGAVNPVGNIRVREASEAYFERMRQLEPKWSEQGFSLEALLSRSEAFVEHFDAHGVFTSSATCLQGLAPKLLITQGKDGLWYADATLPDDRAAAHYILKFSRARNMADWTILKQEAVYMALAREMGLHVAALPEWKNDMLFVPRFDRSVTKDGVLRHHQESLVSLAGLTEPELPGTHNRMLDVLRSHVADPFFATLEYIRRDIMNLALGNNDNSPYNTALQTVNGEVRLTPLYDFAPMYLDTDDISRTLEWVDENGDETGNWADVLRVLPLEAVEKERLRQELRAFSGKLERLDEAMERLGTSDDIITDRYYGIRSQAWQLREL